MKKHIMELAKIYQMLDIVESRIDLECIKKDKATTIMINLRYYIAVAFDNLEKLES